MDNWIDTFWRGDLGGGMAGPETTLQAMLLAFCLGHIVAWVYMWTHRGLSYSRVFVASLVGIPIIVSLLMLLMAGNVVVAFGLLAVFAVVRFRNVLKDTRDTIFVLWAMAMGMGAGTLRFSTAVLGCLFVGFALLYLGYVGFGSRRHFDTILSLRWLSSDRQPLVAVLARHALRCELASERGASDADPAAIAAADLSYRLLLRDPGGSGALMEELRGVGATNASIYRREDESEL